MKLMLVGGIVTTLMLITLYLQIFEPVIGFCFSLALAYLVDELSFFRSDNH